MSYLPRPELSDSCDMLLLVEKEELAVHSQVVMVHSRVLGNMIMDLKDQTPLSIKLSETVAEIKLMLDFLYWRRHSVLEFEEAATLIKLSDKYDIPFLVDMCEDLICTLVPNMHLLGYRYGDKIDEDGQPITCQEDRELWDLAKWLSYAERLEMKKLLPRCQHALMEWFEDFECSTFESFGDEQPAPTEHDVLVELVEKNGVTARTLGGILLACYRRQSADRLQILMSFTPS